MNSSGLTFGIYPGSAVGDAKLSGPPDRPDRINQALAELQGPPGRPFVVRAYDVYADPADTVHAAPPRAPAERLIDRQVRKSARRACLRFCEDNDGWRWEPV